MNINVTTFTQKSGVPSSAYGRFEHFIFKGSENKCHEQKTTWKNMIAWLSQHNHLFCAGKSH
jgi:hypothetical protein